MQLADAEDALRAADDAGAAARQRAADEVAAGRGPGAELLAAARAALSDDLNTPQACSRDGMPARTSHDRRMSPKPFGHARRRQALATLVVFVQVLSATSAPLKMLNDLLHTKAGRKAQDRLQTVAGLASSLGAVLELLGLDAAQPQTALQVQCSRWAAAWPWRARIVADWTVMTQRRCRVS